MKNTPSKYVFLRLKIFIGALLILILAQGFNGGLSLSSLEKLYVKSLISSFEVVGNDFFIKLQSAIRFGKSLEKFYGIDRALKQVKTDLPELDNIFVALPNGRIVHNLQGDYKGVTLKEAMGKAFAETGHFVGMGKKALIFKGEKSRFLMFLLKNREDETAGRVVFVFSNDLIQEKILPALKKNSIILGYITGAGALVLALGLFFFLPLQADGQMPRSRLLLIFILAMGSAQLCYSLYNIQLFRSDYIELTREKTVKLTKFVERDIEFLLKKGLSISRLRKIENQFTKIIQATPEIDYIEVLDNKRHVMNKANRNGKVAVQSGVASDLTAPDDFYDILLPLEKPVKKGAKELKRAGFIQVHLDRDIIQNTVREIFLDSLTVVLISALFVIEMMIFLNIYIRQATLPVEQNTIYRNEELVCTYMLGRPAAFAFLFAWALPASFIPLYMRTLYEPMFGLSRDVVLGLPVSAEMLFALFGALISGTLSDRKGWAAPFILGVVCCAVGSSLSGYAAGGYEFVGFRALTGLGYGAAWMAIQSYIFDNTTSSSRAQGLSHLVAGIISGQICGTAVGAMLAERIEFSPVFIISGLAAFAPILFVLFFMRKQLAAKPVRHLEPGLKLAEVFKLLSNRNYVSILLFSLIPFALCQVGLLFYAAPIYLNNLGFSQSNIGRVLMIYGLSVIYIAPFISRFIDRSPRKKIYITLGGFIGASGLMFLFFYNGFLAVLLAVFLMGLCGSFVGSAQSAFALKLQVTKDVGMGKAMSIQRATDKLGQMLGPIVLGAVIAGFGIGNGIAITGCIFFVATILFVLFAKEKL